MSMMVQSGRFGPGAPPGGGSAPAMRWRVRYAGSERPEASTGSGDHSIAELMFMTSAGAGAQPTTGTPIASSDHASGPKANAFDGNPATYWYDGNTTDPWLGFIFDSDQTITHVSITARTDVGYLQAPKSGFVEYSTDGGATWLPSCYFRAATWTAGATQVIEIAATYLDDDLSALDEPGGYRFYAFQIKGNNYAGSLPAHSAEFVLKAAGVEIQTQFYRNRHVGFSQPAGGYSMPHDGEKSGNYFSLAGVDNYVMLDLGYARVIDQVGVTVRVGFASQGMKQYDLLAGNTAFTVASMSVIKSVNDGAGTPASGATVLFSVP